MRRNLILATSALALLAIPQTLRAQDAAPPQFAAKLTPAELRIETALAKKVKLSYRDTPLKEVIADLAKQVDLPMVLDPMGLEEAGVTADQPTSFEHQNVSLLVALDRLLSPLHLIAFSKRTGLVITARESDQARVLRVYPVRDWVQKSGADDVEALIDVITAHISPDSWSDNGGSCTIAGVGSSLVIEQTLADHRKIEELLWALRAVQADQARAKAGEIGRIVEATNTRDVRESLAKENSRAFEGELKVFVAETSDLFKLPIFLDPVGLEEAGATETTLLHIDQTDAPIRDAIRSALRPLRLGLVVQGEHLLVTSQDVAEELERNTRCYPIYDIADDVQRNSLYQFDDLDVLWDLIDDTISPDTWTRSGGQSVIMPWKNPPALVVTTSDDVHDDIEKLLTSLRAAGARHDFIERNATDDRIIERTYPLYRKRYAMRAAIALKTGLPADAKNEEFADLLTKMGMHGTPANVADPIPTADDVAKLVKDLLPESTWKEEGVLIRPFHDMLIVRHRRATLRKIENCS